MDGCNPIDLTAEGKRYDKWMGRIVGEGEGSWTPTSLEIGQRQTGEGKPLACFRLDAHYYCCCRRGHPMKH